MGLTIAVTAFVIAVMGAMDEALRYSDKGSSGVDCIRPL